MCVLSGLQLIYLSPDAPSILWRVSPSFVYCIGGLVERAGIVSRASLDRAGAMAVVSARLPLREVIPEGLRKWAINIDLVAALLLHVHQAAQTIRQQRGTQPPSQPPPQPVVDAVTSTSTAPSTAAPPPTPPRVSRLGLETRPRAPVGFRRPNAAVYSPPSFPSVPEDEGIDWLALWKAAFDELIPKRIRWGAEGQP